MDLYPLLVLYRDMVPILNAFKRWYRTGAIAPSVIQVLSCTVEENETLIGQALSALGAIDP